MKKLFILMTMFFAGCSSNHSHSLSEVNLKQLPIKDDAQPTVQYKVKKIKNVYLTRDNAIFLNGIVGPSIKALSKKLQEMNEDDKVNEIWVLIDSPGGSVLDGSMFISAMEASEKPVYTVCMNLCASMAAIIHQYGVKRYMIDRSALMFHDASGGLMGTVPQMQSRLSFINRLVTKLDAYVANKANVPLDKFTNDIKSEIWLDGEDATDKGYNDGLIFVNIEGSDSDQLFSLPESQLKFKLENI